MHYLIEGELNTHSDLLLSDELLLISHHVTPPLETHLIHLIKTFSHFFIQRKTRMMN